MIKHLKTALIVAFNIVSAVAITYYYYTMTNPHTFAQFLLGCCVFALCFTKIFSHAHNFSGEMKYFYDGEITSYTSRPIMNIFIFFAVFVLTHHV